MELLIIIFCICIIYKAYEAKIKGYLGEKAVVAALSGLPEGQYKILNDVMLQTEHGTTQIDHIVVSVYGIFVIETKNSIKTELCTRESFGKKCKFRRINLFRLLFFRVTVILR